VVPWLCLAPLLHLFDGPSPPPYFSLLFQTIYRFFFLFCFVCHFFFWVAWPPRCGYLLGLLFTVTFLFFFLFLHATRFPFCLFYTTLYSSLYLVLTRVLPTLHPSVFPVIPCFSPFADGGPPSCCQPSPFFF